MTFMPVIWHINFTADLEYLLIKIACVLLETMVSQAHVKEKLLIMSTRARSWELSPVRI